MTRGMWITIVVAMVLAIPIVYFSREKNSSTGEATATSGSSETSAKPPPFIANTKPVASIPDPMKAGADRALGPAWWHDALATPRATIDTQISLAVSDHAQDFRSTFLPSVQIKITDEAIATCKRTVHSRIVKPDWATAQTKTVDGHQVTRVSIFGKSMTGFVETKPGTWLADDLWCAPPRQ